MMSDQAVTDLPVSTSTMQPLIDFDSSFYGVSRDEMDYIVRNESDYGQYNLGDYVNGQPTSFGAVQIHDPWDKTPAISIAQAMSPVFSINYLAYSLKYGTDHWTTEGWYESSLNSP